MLTYQQNERFNFDLSCNNLFQDKEWRVDHISLQFSQAVSSYKALITTPQACLKHSFHPCPDLWTIPHHLLTYWHLPLSSFLHLVFHLSLISPTLPIRSGILQPDHPPPADNSLLMPKSTPPPCKLLWGQMLSGQEMVLPLLYFAVSMWAFASNTRLWRLWQTQGLKISVSTLADCMLFRNIVWMGLLAGALFLYRVFQRWHLR